MGLYQKNIFLFILFCSFMIQKTYGLDRREKTLFDNRRLNYAEKWVKAGDTWEESLRLMVGLLKKSSIGKELIMNAKRKANEYGQTFYDVVKVGQGSITDTTLIRKFSPSNPSQIVYETRSKVYIDKNLSLFDAVLDLAHELTHYTKRTAFNPYTSTFSLKDFIRSTVEGNGGEVEAYIVECRVMSQLFPRLKNRKSNCEKVFDYSIGNYRKEKGIKQFYRVGDHLKEFLNLKSSWRSKESEFPYLSGREPIFVSSAYSLPYPIAAIREYQAIMFKVCRNDKKRLELLKEKYNSRNFENKSGNKLKYYRKLASSFESRCQKNSLNI